MLKLHYVTESPDVFPPATRPCRSPQSLSTLWPGFKYQAFAKMAASAADVINLDLEDSVAPTDKDAARAKHHSGPSE